MAMAMAMAMTVDRVMAMADGTRDMGHGHGEAGKGPRYGYGRFVSSCPVCVVRVLPRAAPESFKVELFAPWPGGAARGPQNNIIQY